MVPISPRGLKGTQHWNSFDFSISLKVLQQNCTQVYISCRIQVVSADLEKELTEESIIVSTQLQALITSLKPKT